MNYAKWNKLSHDEKRNTHWKHHPRIRIATIFSILSALIFIVFMLRVFQNRRLHVNRKPNNKEAFAIAKVFIKDRVKQPATATFSKNDFRSAIDTAINSYTIASYVDTQDSSGKIINNKWEVRLAYTGGDWSDRNSWKLLKVSFK